MPIIKWRDSYSVGVEKFDNAHTALLEIINDMFVVVRDHQSVEHLSDAMNKLIRYTQEHFIEEEKELEKINFPKLDEHKKVHAELLQEVAAYKVRIDNKEEEATVGLYHFLRNWLITHILDEDMQYKPFFVNP